MSAEGQHECRVRGLRGKCLVESTTATRHYAYALGTLHLRQCRIALVRTRDLIDYLTMTLTDFKASLKDARPPAVAPALVALWHDARGDWDAAHTVAQDAHDATGARVHAYLHRKEGDIDNARYWYGQAGAREATGSLEAEWETIVEELLGRHEIGGPPCAESSA